MIRTQPKPNTRPRYTYVQARAGYDSWDPARYDIEDGERVTSARRGEYRAIAREVLLEDARVIVAALNRE